MMKKREIYFSDFLYECLLSWRRVLIAMLIGALAFGGLSFVKADRAVKASRTRLEAVKEQLKEVQAADESEKQEYSKEWAQKGMTPVQIANVEKVVLNEQFISKESKYLESIGYDEIDIASVPKAEIILLITSDDMDRTYEIEKAYEKLLTSGEVFAWICEKDERFQAPRIAEYWDLSAETKSRQENRNTVGIQFYYTDEAECADILALTVDYVNEKHAEWAKVLGKHEVQVLSQSVVNAAFDIDNINKQRNFMNDISNLQTTLAKAVNDFSALEKRYYEYLTDNIVDEGDESAVEKALETEKNQLESVGAASISLKYVIVGMLFGALIYVFAFLMKFLLNVKLLRWDNLEVMYGIAQLGKIEREESKKKWFGFVDHCIKCIRDRNVRSFSYDEAVTLTTTAIKMAVKREKLQQVTVIGCAIPEYTMGILHIVKEALEKENIHMTVLNNILYDAEAMASLEDAQAVVLAETAKVTLYKEIEKELAVLERQNIKALGGIVIE